MENQTKKEVVFSAIQPSGTITLGNYLGAVRNWVTMQNEYDCIYALADLHTITVRQTPAVMRKNIIDAYASIMACGIDVEKVFSSFRVMFTLTQSLHGRSAVTHSSASFQE